MDSNRDISEISTNKGSAGFPGSGGGSSGAGSGSGSGGQFDSATLEERQLLGRYGVWLLVGLCTPNQDTSIEILGRLLSMLFHWFHVTAYSFDGTKKSLMHLIFSVGNLTLRIFIHLMNVERRWAVDGRRRVSGRSRDVASKSSKRRGFYEGLRSHSVFEIFWDMYICTYVFFIIICLISIAVTADVRSQTSTPLLKNRMTSATMSKLKEFYKCYTENIDLTKDN